MKEFTKIAQDYDKGRSGEDVIFWAGETKELARLDEESIILDMGCGTGIYTVGLRDHTSATTCGLDPSVGMLSQAKEKTRSIHWFNAVGERLPIQLREREAIPRGQSCGLPRHTRPRGER